MPPPSLGLGLGLPRATSAAGEFDPLSLSPAVLWKAANALESIGPDDPAEDSDPIRRVNDASGNGVHLNQSTVNNQPIATLPTIFGFDGISFDGTDDFMTATLPDLTGTMVAASNLGIAIYEIDMSAGSFDFELLGTETGYYRAGDLAQIAIWNRELTTAEKALLTAYYAALGCGDFSGVTNFSYFWRGRSDITEFPVIDTSNGTNFLYAFAAQANRTAFPALNINKGRTFRLAWWNNTGMTTFPPNVFDNWTGTPASFCFDDAWLNDTSLTSQSVENILVSIAASGQNAPASNPDITVDYDGSGLTPATTAAISTLKSRSPAWTVTINSVPQ